VSETSAANTADLPLLSTYGGRRIPQRYNGSDTPCLGIFARLRSVPAVCFGAVSARSVVARRSANPVHEVSARRTLPMLRLIISVHVEKWPPGMGSRRQQRMGRGNECRDTQVADRRRGNRCRAGQGARGRTRRDDRSTQWIRRTRDQAGLSRNRFARVWSTAERLAAKKHSRTRLRAGVAGQSLPLMRRSA
jgi:hypothetical protein